MSTIVNNPPSGNSSDSVLSTLIGVAVLSVLVYLVWVYGVPAVRNSNFGRPQIVVPEQIDINVNQSE